MATPAWVTSELAARRRADGMRHLNPGHGYEAVAVAIATEYDAAIAARDVRSGVALANVAVAVRRAFAQNDAYFSGAAFMAACGFPVSTP